MPLPTKRSERHWLHITPLISILKRPQSERQQYTADTSKIILHDKFKLKGTSNQFRYTITESEDFPGEKDAFASVRIVTSLWRRLTIVDENHILSNAILPANPKLNIIHEDWTLIYALSSITTEQEIITSIKQGNPWNSGTNWTKSFLLPCWLNKYPLFWINQIRYFRPQV